jgi:hypothetical protein
VSWVSCGKDAPPPMALACPRLSGLATVGSSTSARARGRNRLLIDTVRNRTPAIDDTMHGRRAWRAASSPVSLRLNPISGALQHSAQVDHLLGVDAFVPRRLEGLCLVSEGHEKPAVVCLFDVGHRLKKRDDCPPVDVVTNRVLQDLRDGSPVVAIQMKEGS